VLPFGNLENSLVDVAHGRQVWRGGATPTSPGVSQGRYSDLTDARQL
jgi:hypothetical protein